MSEPMLPGLFHVIVHCPAHPDVEQPCGRCLELKAAQQARDAAIAQADDHAAEAFREAAYAALTQVAKTRARFIVDDVWRAVGPHAPHTHENRAMGAVMQRGRKARIIAPTEDFQPSAQRQCHANPRRVWQSLVYGS